MQLPVFHFNISSKTLKATQRSFQQLTAGLHFTLQTYFCIETVFLFGLQGRICYCWVAAYKLSVKQNQTALRKSNNLKQPHRSRN